MEQNWNCIWKSKYEKRTFFCSETVFKFKLAKLKSHKCYCSFLDNNLQCQLEKISIIFCQSQLKKRFWKSALFWHDFVSVLWLTHRSKKTPYLKVRPLSILKSPPAFMGRGRQLVSAFLHTFPHKKRIGCSVQSKVISVRVARENTSYLDYISPRKKSQLMIHIQRAKFRQDWVTLSDSLYHKTLHLRSLHLSCHSTQKSFLWSLKFLHLWRTELQYSSISLIDNAYRDK